MRALVAQVAAQTTSHIAQSRSTPVRPGACGDSGLVALGRLGSGLVGDRVVGLLGLELSLQLGDPIDQGREIGMGDRSALYELGGRATELTVGLGQLPLPLERLDRPARYLRDVCGRLLEAIQEL